ncbi:PEP-CTERM sorting domain-containing protein [Geminisphaera colitermitum]|uniref:PEP-CTERM sorting domain-containing protein n=1 Tax=Geminisphaera colitermitum TaxID=1148786 RepID=UPI00019651F8|nr:PEP-CTERM sorting domain-containing protein [Geminisphaera colitermitum]
MNPTSKLNYKTPCIAALLGLVTFLVSAPAQAASVSIGYNKGSGAGNGNIPGLKLTMSAVLDPEQLEWELTSFTWLTSTGSSAVATGRNALYIFDASVFTSPGGMTTDNITSATAGFIAQSDSYTAGSYVFSSAVILKGDKTYYFLNSTALGAGGTSNYGFTTSSIAGMERWSGNGSTKTWNSSASSGAPNFAATFIPVPVPEPATVTALLGLVGIALFLFKRRR